MLACLRSCSLLFLGAHPLTFLPALCGIFLDETAQDNVLEVTACANTYYLAVFVELTRPNVAVVVVAVLVSV